MVDVGREIGVLEAKVNVCPVSIRLATCASSLQFCTPPLPRVLRAYETHDANVDFTPDYIVHMGTSVDDQSSRSLNIQCCIGLGAK